jgi:hypothetical protein
MRASLAVAVREYNGRATRWKIRSTTFTKPNRSVIVAARGLQISSFTFAEDCLRACGSALALRCG